MDKYSLDINGGSQIKGIKIKKLSMLIALATAIISVFLVIGIYFSFSNYQKVLKVSDDYVEWQQTAQKMRETSDFLTEQARAFAETGHIKYINYYFKEIENDKNRDRSLNYIKEQFPDSDLYASLKQAFEGSVRLMETEFLLKRRV